MATGGGFGRSWNRECDEYFDYSCTPCSAEGKNVEASNFCVECEEYFCFNCVNHYHKFGKAKTHTILDQAGMKTRGPQQTTSHPTEKCQLHHGNILDTFCVWHDAVCCGTCVSLFHNECRTKCAGCNGTLEPSDWVRRARDQVFHLQCFQCQMCNRKLSTGDTFLMKGDSVLCTEHGDTHVPADDGDNWSVSSVDSDSRSSETSDEKGGKRARTTFTKEQALYLQESFMRNPLPSSEEVDQLADAIGHARRVVMVWFQNARARNKRMHVGGTTQSVGQSRKSGSRQYSSQPCSPASVINLD